MLAEKQKEQRANLIQKYYNGITNYELNTKIIDGDGTGTPGDPASFLIEARYNAFNNLIVQYYDELKHIIGYAYDSNALLTGSEVEDPPAQPPTNIWWKNCDISRLQEAFFYLDSNALSSDTFNRFNGKEIPYQRHPFALLNQYNSVLGTISISNSPEDYGWLNMDPSETYTDLLNPFAIGTSFRLKEPLEYYGDTSNLLWGKIIYDGLFVYRNYIINNTSFITHSESGFTRLNTQIGTYGINNSGDPNNGPSPFEKMRYTQWGVGGNSFSATKTISSHSGTTTGSFSISVAAAAPDPLNGAGWYAIYTSTLTEGWIVNITNATYNNGGGSGPYTWDYSYNNSTWPIPTSGNFNGSKNFIKNPVIADSIKTDNAGITDGRRNIWNSIYDQYYSDFKSKADSLATIITAIQSDRDDIINYDYTVINNVMGSDFGKSQTTTTKTNWNIWITEWKTLINDTGSGATYTRYDNKWTDSNLNGLITKIKTLIAFGSDNYSNIQSGYIADRRKEAYEILGRDTSGNWYILGTNEQWRPANGTDANNNNTGTLIGGTLYFWRHYFIDKRLNRVTGNLAIAYRGYVDAYTSTLRSSPVSDIKALETTIDNILPGANDPLYDLTPLNITITKNEIDRIILEWDSVISASCYRIERKEGQSGSWTPIETQFGYQHPGVAPNYNFKLIPPNKFEDMAAYQGYQEFGLTFSDRNATPPLTNTMSQYSFKISIDGGSIIEIILVGADCQSWDALSNMINEIAKEKNYSITSNIVGTSNYDIRISSNKFGAESSIALTAGTTGTNLFTALSCIPDAAVPGTTNLEEGKVYYYRIRVNNGWNEAFDATPPIGAPNDQNDKDWNSISDWQITEYNNDKATHGDAGSISWSPPINVKVSGIYDNGVTPSDAHVRIEWSPTTNASKYKIYRSTLRGSGYVYIDNTTNTYYEDTDALPGLSYWYRISAVADSSEFEFYDTSNNLTIEFESEMSNLTEESNGKRLWKTIALTATTTDPNKVTLSWNSLSGATGYLIYTANSETSQFSYISNDDGTKKIFISNSYEDRYEAEQFLLDDFTSGNDGISDTVYTANTRYYFIIIVSDPTTYLSTIKQYYITSPSSGTWKISDISTSINNTISTGLNNTTCELITLNDPHNGLLYRVKFKSVAKGERATISIIDGTFGESLLSLFTKKMAKSANGGGALPAVSKFYKVKGVEVVSGRIVRESEFSEIAEGLRPIELP